MARSGLWGEGSSNTPSYPARPGSYPMPILPSPKRPGPFFMCCARPLAGAGSQIDFIPTMEPTFDRNICLSSAPVWTSRYCMPGRTLHKEKGKLKDIFGGSEISCWLPLPMMPFPTLQPSMRGPVAGLRMNIT